MRFAQTIRIDYVISGSEEKVTIAWKNPFPNALRAAIGVSIVVIVSVWTLWIISTPVQFVPPQFQLVFTIVWFLPIAVSTFLLSLMIVRGAFGSREEMLTLSLEQLTYRPSRIPSPILLTYDQVSRVSVAALYGDSYGPVLQQIFSNIMRPKTLRINRGLPLTVVFNNWGEGPEFRLNCKSRGCFFIGPFVAPSKLRAISSAVEKWINREDLRLIYLTLKQDLLTVPRVKMTASVDKSLEGEVAQTPKSVGMAINHQSSQTTLTFKSLNGSWIGSTLLLAATLSIVFAMDLSSIVAVSLCWIVTMEMFRRKRLLLAGPKVTVVSGVFPFRFVKRFDFEQIASVRQVRNELTYSLYVDDYHGGSSRLVRGLDKDASDWIGNRLAFTFGSEYVVSKYPVTEAVGETPSSG